MPKLTAKEAARFDLKNTHEQRKDRVTRLRDELNVQIDMVCFSRESLQKEIVDSIDPHGWATSAEFLKKLTELTKAFNALTDARIRLLKAERQAEEDVTPDEEKQTVRDFIRGLEVTERGLFIDNLIRSYQLDNPTHTRAWGYRKGMERDPVEQ